MSSDVSSHSGDHQHQRGPSTQRDGHMYVYYVYTQIGPRSVVHSYTLFTELVLACIPPSTVDVSKLPAEVQSKRSHLIRLCGAAEGHLEIHYSSLLGSSLHDNPLDNLSLFPYYTNYIKLSLLEHTILTKHLKNGQSPPARIAFVGSGPMPLTSIVQAKYHMKSTAFHNYDIDPSANAMAARLVAADPDLSKRMHFHTRDVMDATVELRDYDVVFLAALVGMDKGEKVRVLEHLARYMAPGALLMLRSAAGARAFLYPVVEEGDLGDGFQVLSEFHPTDDVINSVIIARKKVHHHTPVLAEQQGMAMTCKLCSNIKEFCSPLAHGCMMEELAMEEQAS